MKKAYKVFEPDWTCRDYDFKKNGIAVGTRHYLEGNIKLCEHGFHYCLKLVDCFNYYSFNSSNKVAEIEVIGEFKSGDVGKEVTNEFKIIREISWFEVLELVNIGTENTGKANTGDRNTGDRNTGHQNTGDRNTGDWNTGDWNTGDQNTGHQNTGHWNTGDRNTGHRNTGDRNTGHRNTGDWNTGDRNTGHFNTVTPETILVFNKECSRKDWDNTTKPDFIYFEGLTKFIWSSVMTDEEKKEHQGHECLGGYLRKTTYKEAFKYSWDNADKEDRKLVLELPNFDNEIFKEISGIDVLKELEKES